MKAKTKTINRRDNKLQVLLRDFGYRITGNDIVKAGIRGFTSDRIIGRCRSLLDAAETLAPIIRENEYTARLIEITKC